MQQVRWAVLALAAVCALLVLLLSRGAVSRFQAQSAPFELVVSRYAEDLEWLNAAPFDAFDSVLVYDKNNDDLASTPPPARARVVKLPNVGREGHTYLHHIIKNWDQLADVTVFVPASSATSSYKQKKVHWVVERALTTRNSAFPDQASSSLVEELGDFTTEEYKSSDERNAALNPESSLAPSRHRPLRVWLEAHGLPDVDGVTYHGIFAVSRAHIHRQPREFYEHLIRDLQDHSSPEAGHFLERSWLSVFHPVPPECRQSTE